MAVARPSDPAPVYAPAPAYAPAPVVEVYPDTVPAYTFEYAVADSYNNNFGHNEARYPLYPFPISSKRFSDNCSNITLIEIIDEIKDAHYLKIAVQIIRMNGAEKQCYKILI
jgi:hypothetical protein